MAHLTLAVFCAAFALIAATPNNYYGNDNYVQQPQANDAPGFDCSGKENGAYSLGECSQDYWLCWDEVATSQHCTMELMFNEQNGQCDFATNIVACGKQLTEAPLNDHEEMKPVNFDCTGHADGDYPFYQGTCQVEYVSCVDEAPWKRSCPDDLQFDPEHLICNRLENIIACGGSPLPANDVPVLDYECPTPNGAFALVSTLCSPMYYKCEDNVATIATCQDEMIWDDSVKQCRLPADIPDCSFSCVGKADSAYSIGCSQNYWWCWEEKATKLACPEGMVFNGENNECDLHEHVFECTGKRFISTTAASDFATPAPVDFDCTNVEDGNHAFTHGGMCQPRFVSCVYGIAYELTCPDGLLFDRDQLICERIERIVACGGSLEEPTTTQAYDNSYVSYNEPTTRSYRKAYKAAEPTTRRAYKQKTTTLAAEPTTELPADNYGSYETSTIAEPTTRKSYGKKLTTPAAEPTTRASYYQKKTTAAAEPTTRASYYQKKTTVAAEPTTRASYYQKKTTPAAEPTTRASYYQKKTTPAAEPTTKKSYQQPIRSRVAHIKPVNRASYYQDTPAAEPTTRASYYQKKTTPAAEPTTRASYYQKKTTTPAAEPTTRAYYQKKTTPAAEPTTRASYYQKKTTPAAEPTTRASYYQKKTTPAAEPTTRASYYQKKTTTPAAEPTTRAYYQKKTTPAAEPTTKKSYQQPIRSRVVHIKPVNRASYYQKTTPAAEPTTRASYYQKKTTTPAAEPTTRASYYQKKTTTPAAEPTTRRSYYQTTTPAAEPTTRQSYSSVRKVVEQAPRRTYKLTAANPTTREPQIKQASYY